MDNTMDKNLGKLLSDPFEASDVKWRVQQSGITKASKGWVMVIPYITSRAIQQRLDDVFGVGGWQNTFQQTPDGKGYLCGLSFKSNSEWITKWDGAEFTGIEALKGAISGAMKRAGVQLGIGRYLYNLKTEFVNCSPVGGRFSCAEDSNFIEIKMDKRNKNSPKVPFEWYPPPLPGWALPNVKAEDLMVEIVNAKDVITLKSAYARAYNYANSFNRGDLVKSIVELKDKRKSQLVGENNKEEEAEIRKIRAWLERSVTDDIVGVSNESVLKLAKQLLSKKIHQKSAYAGIDPIQFLEVLESYCLKELNTLNVRR